MKEREEVANDDISGDVTSLSALPFSAICRE
jgi:hypothetical protein